MNFPKRWIAALAIFLFVGYLFRSASVLNAQSPITEINGVAWSLDGSQIAMAGFTGSNNKNVKPIFTVRNAVDMSVVLDLTFNPAGQIQSILSLAWSPDGKYLVSGSADGTIAVWTINDPARPSGQLLAKFGNYNTPVNNVTWSPDGKWIASIASYQQISIWNATNYDYHLIDSTPTSEAGYTVWSPNSMWLARPSSNGAVIYNISSVGAFVQSSTYYLVPKAAYPGIPGVAWNSSGSQIALASTLNNKIYVYDVSTNTPTLSRTVNLSSTPGRLAWSPDGRLFAFSGENSTARVVNATTGAELASYTTGKRGGVESLAWSPDGSKLAFSSAGDTAQVVAAPDIAEIQAVAWSPDGTQIAMGGYTSPSVGGVTTPIFTIRNVADMSTVVLDLAATPGGHTKTIRSVAWSPDGKYLVSGSQDGTIAVWAINDSQYSPGKLLAKFGNYDISVANVTWSPNGKWITSIASYQRISIWNATNYDYHLIDTTPTYEAGYTAWSPDSTLFATSSSSGAAIFSISSIGNFVSASPYRLIPSPAARGISGVAWNTSGSLIALASSYDNKIYIYNALAYTPFSTVNLSSSPGILAWSPDGTLFAFSSDNKTVRIANATTGVELASYATGKYGEAENIFWKPDGSKLAFSSAGDTAQVVDSPDIAQIQAVAWNPDGSQIAMSGFTELGNHTNVRPILTVRNSADMSLVLDLAANPVGQTGSILSLSWSPDGKYLVSGSVDGTIAVWAINDPARTSGQLLAKFGNYNTDVNNVTWSPDGKWIASIAYTQQISIWNATNYDYHLIDITPIGGAGYLAWSPNSVWLAHTGSTGAVIYNISSSGAFVQASTYQLIPEDNFVGITGIAWSANGSQIALSSVINNKIYVYDVSGSTPTISRSINVSSPPGFLAWKPDGSQFAYGDRNSAVRIINAMTGVELASYPTGIYGAVDSIAWKPDGSELAFSNAAITPQVVAAPDITAATPTPVSHQ